jgi:hypothetical protein
MSTPTLSTSAGSCDNCGQPVNLLTYVEGQALCGICLHDDGKPVLLPTDLKINTVEVNGQSFDVYYDQIGHSVFAFYGTEMIRETTVTFLISQLKLRVPEPMARWQEAICITFHEGHLPSVERFRLGYSVDPDNAKYVFLHDWDTGTSRGITYGKDMPWSTQQEMGDDYDSDTLTWFWLPYSEDVWASLTAWVHQYRYLANRLQAALDKSIRFSQDQNTVAKLIHSYAQGRAVEMKGIWHGFVEFDPDEPESAA